MVWAAACGCPTVAGPTAPAASNTVTLAPGDLQYFDADTPQSTTQIDLTFRIDAESAPIRLRQIDPGCVPAANDACQTYYDAVLPARPSGVVQFGNTLQPFGPRTRIVLQNPSADSALALTLTVEPRRAGCT